MAKKKKSTDVNVAAFEILQEVTGELPCHASPTGKEPAKKKDQPEKNPAAVALGRLGGLKGGKARAYNLSARQRKEIAKKAALARWTKRK
jgi:hypothetical protein